MNKVQILREEKNLTQSELAEKSGLSLRTIQRIEAGNIPKGFTLKSLAKALETEPEILFQNENQNSEISRAKIINISSLSFLLLPFGNIIIPAILTYRTKNKQTKALGVCRT
ncbi:helix-turn-helix transcriptional regulator [Reichenbachiella sp. MALMAid0571]|uniref:helix-turn-helix domain-containing protein n=1 Tax=Reichenbachiella sp. MALMAid0571 TaxID=3143939 RepID=UPI0032DE8983